MQYRQCRNKQDGERRGKRYVEHAYPACRGPGYTGLDAVKTLRESGNKKKPRTGTGGLGRLCTPKLEVAINLSQDWIWIASKGSDIYAG